VLHRESFPCRHLAQFEVVTCGAKVQAAIHVQEVEDRKRFV
jgi:hypothetical protein